MRTGKNCLVCIFILLLVFASINIHNPSKTKGSIITAFHGKIERELSWKGSSREDSWGMFRRNASRNSFAEGVEAPETNNTIWTFNTTNSNTGNAV